ncbi:GNAT superfamily N-acetyltransferase [Nocardiopsis arvandica]|uniref:GNAT superfamily N-acetyltransferase n=1 Tax=Nocardiopsis sinuspersici TaxID=501010 RepID=A0A7Y9X8M5_9ACTN|nr:GNAT superfamily N-acetyltransferase [Nocardiopsis sinuspersici]
MDTAGRADRRTDGSGGADADEGADANTGGSAPAGAEPVRLVRLDLRTPEAALLRRAVLRHRLPPGQRGHVRPPVTTLPAADADPARTPFAVTVSGLPVADAAAARAACAGFGVLDRAVHARDLVPDPARAVLLRAFYLTTAWQGRGVGRAVCSAPLLDRLAADVAPHATELVLCVNEANHVAAHVYRAAGFAPTGHRFLDAQGEAQLVMTRPLAAGA